MINFDGIEESKGRSGQLPNGPYVLKVVKISYEPTNKWGDTSNSAQLVFDVAEGAYKDALANRPEFAHSIDLRFDRNIGLLKHQLMCISRSNQGFDALSAFNSAIDMDDKYHARALKAFEGKLFGANLVTYHKPKKDGSDGTTIKAWVVYDAKEVRDGHDKDGNAIEPLPDQYKMGYTPRQEQPDEPHAVEVAEDDIPF